MTQEECIRVGTEVALDLVRVGISVNSINLSLGDGRPTVNSHTPEEKLTEFIGPYVSIEPGNVLRDGAVHCSIHWHYKGALVRGFAYRELAVKIK